MTKLFTMMMMMMEIYIEKELPLHYNSPTWRNNYSGLGITILFDCQLCTPYIVCRETADW